MNNEETTKRALTADDIDFLVSLQEEMLTQDTMCQADPRFWVVRESLDEPCWAEQADHYTLVTSDGDRIGELDYYEENTGAFTCVPEHRVHRNAENTLFLTLREAQNHIARNNHNYHTDAHPYAMTAWRSPQVEQLYKILQEVDWSQLR